MRKLIILFCLFLIGCSRANIDEGSLSFAFCPEFDCESIFLNYIAYSNESVYCALYDMSSEVEKMFIDLQERSKVNVNIIVDKKYSDKYFVRTKKTNHNKFCIIDEKYVITGSTNPTFNGFNKNQNNLVLIESKLISSFYLDEFDRLNNNVVGRVKEKVSLSGIPIDILFCPGCEDYVLKVLDSANESVYFMTFSFTNGKVRDLLLNKNIEIKGVYERTQNSKWSVINELNETGLINAYYGGKLHHKVFIIDEKIVITGSANPTKNGYHNNHENILIIYDEAVAEIYLRELDKFI